MHCERLHCVAIPGPVNHSYVLGRTTPIEVGEDGMSDRCDDSFHAVVING